MKEWFKARNIWGAALLKMTDEEAGRFAKALWLYTMEGTEQYLPGSEEALFAIAKMTLDMDEETQANISAMRAQAGSKGGKQRVANQANASVATTDEANEANASNKNKNKNIDKEKDNKRFIPPTLDEVRAYCKERNNNIDPEYFITYYENRNWELSNKKKMKDWRLAIVTWERNNFSSSPKQKVVPVQTYGQRDYSDEDEEARKRMLGGWAVKAE